MKHFCSYGAFVIGLILFSVCLLSVHVVDASETEAFVNEARRVLVIVDNNNSQASSHSQLFKMLEGKGYKVTYRKARDSTITISSYGEYLYDNIVFLASGDDVAGELRSVNNIREFLESGHNIFISAQKGKLCDSLREFLNEIGVEFDQEQSLVIDHFNYDTVLDESIGYNKHTTIYSAKFSPIFKSKLSKPVLFHGLGASLDKDNHLLFPLLSGEATSYSFDPNEPIESDPHVAGTKTTLVGGYQSKHLGARVTFVGSDYLLSDKFFDAAIHKRSEGDAATTSGNKEFTAELIKWAFQERGFLRHRSVLHHKQGESEIPENYRVSEDLYYSVIIEEWNGDSLSWVPYVAQDIQLEFIMLDPYIRNFLKHESNGKYVLKFSTPDVYGVFKCKVDYRRPGYTPLVFSDQVTVRPMRINEFERFIPAAFPYYTSVFSMMIAFFIFGFLFLFTSNSEKAKKD